MNLTGLLFSYQGRINRGKFWLAVLAYFIIGIVIGIVMLIPVLGWIVAAIVYIAMIVSGIFVVIKRLHDRGKPGWWLLVFYVVPLLLSIVGLYLTYEAGEQTSAATLLSLISLALYLWAFVELGCLRGTVGPNEYGPDPIAPQPGH